MHERPMSPVEQSQHEYRKAAESMGKYLREVDIAGKTILDFGCGWGGETLWLSHNGAQEVIGLDIDEESLTQARAFVGASNIRFVSDIAGINSSSIDFVFSTDVFEHVMDLPAVLSEMYRILRPGGAVLSRFGPLFYSPYGCHFYWAKLFPWSHLIMGRDWLVRRINRIRGYDIRASSWEQLGLNRVTLDQFSNIVSSTKFEIKRLRAIPVAGMPLVTNIPGVRRFMTFGCDIHIVKSR